MNDRVREAFDQIRAEDELKNHTKEYIAQKTHGYRQGWFLSHRRLATAMACLAFVLLFSVGGYFSYFTPVSAICVDVNPSVEIGINRFDRVVSVEGYNEDGDKVAAALDICHLNYKEALERILADESMAGYLTPEQLISITVIETSTEKRDEMLADVSECTASYQNVHCASGDAEEVAGAHEAGMSCGKYKAFLELQALDPDITVEEVRGMTMRQIWDMIDELSGGESAAVQENSGQGTGHGCGHGSRHGQGGGNAWK